MMHAQEIFNDTKGFINTKCKKDHLFSPVKANSSMMRSLYSHDFHKQKIRTEGSFEQLRNIGKYSNQRVKNFGQMGSVNLEGSIYKSSFRANQKTPKPEYAHQNKSFFLKHAPYQKMISQYKRKMSPQNLKPQLIKHLNQKGKPQLGHLIVPSTNRMSQISEYKRSFHGKLPSIQKQKKSLLQTTRLSKKKMHRKTNSSSLWVEHMNLKDKNQLRLTKML